MLRSITAMQFREWQEFDELEPFGPERLDDQFGHINQTLKNVYRKREEPFTREDATLFIGEDAEDYEKKLLDREREKREKAAARMPWREMQQMMRGVIEG